MQGSEGLYGIIGKSGFGGWRDEKEGFNVFKCGGGSRDSRREGKKRLFQRLVTPSPLDTMTHFCIAVCCSELLGFSFFLS